MTTSAPCSSDRLKGTAQYGLRAHDVEVIAGDREQPDPLCRRAGPNVRPARIVGVDRSQRTDRREVIAIRQIVDPGHEGTAIFVPSEY